MTLDSYNPAKSQWFRCDSKPNNSRLFIITVDLSWRDYRLGNRGQINSNINQAS